MGLTSTPPPPQQAAHAMLREAAEKIHQLSPDAAKLALWLAHASLSQDTIGIVSAKTDDEWVFRVSKIIAMPPHRLRKALNRLVKEDLLRRVGAVNVFSKTDPMSEGRALLSLRVSSVSAAVEVPPWEQETESEIRGSVGEADRKEWSTASDERTSRARSARTSRASASPPSSKPLVCSSCGEPEHTQPLDQACFEATFISPHKFVVDAVVQMYADCYRGAKLTVNGKAGSIVKRLLAAHSAAEIVRRARFMFYERRRWPAPPYHFGTLSSHFDSFVPIATPGGMADRDAQKTGSGYYGAVDDV